jgi:hypothetical protein
MKLFRLFIFSIFITANVNANESNVKYDAVATQKLQPQPSAVKAIDESKEVTKNVLVEILHQHDVLKTQFLGKRPYMDTNNK